MKTPKPRTGNYLGMPIVNQLFGDGTWIEGEEFCYPNRGMTRRAYVKFPNGKKRIVKCGIPGTYFSIPASKGFITISEDGLIFNQKQKA